MHVKIFAKSQFKIKSFVKCYTWSVIHSSDVSHYFRYWLGENICLKANAGKYPFKALFSSNQVSLASENGDIGQQWQMRDDGVMESRVKTVIIVLTRESYGHWTTPWVVYSGLSSSWPSFSTATTKYVKANTKTYEMVSSLSQYQLLLLDNIPSKDGPCPWCDLGRRTSGVR